MTEILSRRLTKNTNHYSKSDSNNKRVVRKIFEDYYKSEFLPTKYSDYLSFDGYNRIHEIAFDYDKVEGVSPVDKAKMCSKQGITYVYICEPANLSINTEHSLSVSDFKKFTQTAMIKAETERRNSLATVSMVCWMAFVRYIMGALPGENLF